jgi:hypothetical protein
MKLRGSLREEFNADASNSRSLVIAKNGNSDLYLKKEKEN